MSLPNLERERGARLALVEVVMELEERQAAAPGASGLGEGREPVVEAEG